MRLFSSVKRHLGQGFSGLKHNAKKLSGGAVKGFSKARHFGSSVAHRVEQIPYVGQGLRRAIDEQIQAPREELGGRSIGDTFKGAQRGVRQVDRFVQDPSIREAQRALQLAEQEGLPVDGLNRRLRDLEQLRTQ